MPGRASASPRRRPPWTPSHSVAGAGADANTTTISVLSWSKAADKCNQVGCARCSKDKQDVLACKKGKRGYVADADAKFGARAVVCVMRAF